MDIDKIMDYCVRDVIAIRELCKDFKNIKQITKKNVVTNVRVDSEIRYIYTKFVEELVDKYGAETVRDAIYDLYDYWDIFSEEEEEEQHIKNEPASRLPKGCPTCKYSKTSPGSYPCCYCGLINDNNVTSFYEEV